MHPRSVRNVPRVLGKYVRDRKILTLEGCHPQDDVVGGEGAGETARQTLQAGHFADVVIFDPATIGDRATFEESHQLSVGVRDVGQRRARAGRRVAYGRSPRSALSTAWAQTGGSAARAQPSAWGAQKLADMGPVEHSPFANHQCDSAGAIAGGNQWMSRRGAPCDKSRRRKSAFRHERGSQSSSTNSDCVKPGPKESD